MACTRSSTPTRSEIFLEAPVFSTNGAAGMNNVNVRDAVIDGTNTIVYGVFDDVDIRSEARFDELSTEFTHLTLDGEHAFSDTFRAARRWSATPRPSTTIRCRRRCCSIAPTSTATATTIATTTACR